jgi:polar amino acid transport system substrate-binding protein
MQSAGSTHPRLRGPLAGAAIAIVATLLLPLAGADSTSAATLDRVREQSKLTLGYRVDVRPFSYQDASGSPTGYSVALCQKVADSVKAELGLADLAIDWVPVTIDERFTAVAQGKIDLLCVPDVVTLSRRKEVSFSVPVYPGGIGAILRADAPAALQDVLVGRPPSGPIWRASPAQVLEAKTFAVVKGSTSEEWLASRLDKFQLDARVVPVENYDAGIAAVLDGNANVFFGDRSVLLDAAAGSKNASELIVLERSFTTEPLALALPRNDNDFRLAVDRALSGTYASPEFRDIYRKWFGLPDEFAWLFFRQSGLAD